jgi:heat shock protein HslJ
MERRDRKRKMTIGRTTLICIACLSACLLAACRAATQDQPPADLAGTAWALTTVNGTALVEGTAITLRFDDTELEGSAGCNHYGGSYAASADDLHISGVYATEMACMEPAGVMAQEQAYLAALNAVAQYQLVDDRLEMTDASGAQVLAFVSSTSEALAEKETPGGTTPTLSLNCTLEVDEAHAVGEPVNLRFALRNSTDRPLYVLTWYTPLEGIAGDIFQIARDGQALPYQGMLAKRGDPDRAAYIPIGPGETASAEVDLSMGYDLSTPGAYQAQLTTGLGDVTDDASLVPQRREDHRPQPLSCNTVRFQIVPAPGTPVATATVVPPVTPATEPPTPPAGARHYLDTATGVSFWLPESWIVVEPGPHGGPITLQSYPQEKYVGGEPFQPGDTKCDLTVHPAGTSAEALIQQIKSGPLTTVVSEEEVVLRSGQPGTRLEIDSMGRSLTLVADIDGRAVTLSCFGTLEPFDEIGSTLGTEEVP